MKMKSIHRKLLRFRLMFQKSKFICFLLSLLSFFSCRNQSLQKFEPFIDSVPGQDLGNDGTSELWAMERGKVSESGYPRALLLNHGEEALILRINLIRSAKESISIQTFSWEFDEVGKFILWELIEANQNRGVKVNLLIDHMLQVQHQVFYIHMALDHMSIIFYLY